MSGKNQNTEKLDPLRYLPGGGILAGSDLLARLAPPSAPAEITAPAPSERTLERLSLVKQLESEIPEFESRLRAAEFGRLNELQYAEKPQPYLDPSQVIFPGQLDYSKRQYEVDQLERELLVRRRKLGELLSDDRVTRDAGLDAMDQLGGITAADRAYEFVGSAGKGFMRGFSDLARAGKRIADVVGLGTEEAVSRVLGVDPSTMPTTPAADNPVTYGLDRTAKAIDITMETLLPEQIALRGGVEQGLGQGVGQVANSALMGGLGRGAQLSAGALQSFSQGYEEAMANGASDRDALLAGAAYAGIDSANFGPISKALDKIAPEARQPWMRTLLKGGKLVTSGAVEEMEDTVAGNLVARQLFDPDRDPSEGAGEAAGYGGILSPLSLIGSGRKRRRREGASTISAMDDRPRMDLELTPVGESTPEDPVVPENRQEVDRWFAALENVAPEPAKELAAEFLDPLDISLESPVRSLVHGTYRALASADDASPDELTRELASLHWDTLAKPRQEELERQFVLENGVPESEVRPQDLRNWYGDVIAREVAGSSPDKVTPEQAPAAVAAASADFQRQVNRMGDWVARQFGKPPELLTRIWQQPTMAALQPRDRAEVEMEVAELFDVLPSALRESVVVVDSAESIPDAKLREKVLAENAKDEGKVDGIYHRRDGKIYLIADTVRDARRVMRHEMLHWAVDRGPVAVEYRQLLGNIASSIPVDQRRELEAKYRTTNHDLLAQEYLAELAQNDPQHQTWQRFSFELKRLLARIFGDRVQFSEVELRQFVVKAAAGVVRDSGGVAVPGEWDALFSKRDLRDIERMVLMDDGVIGTQRATHYSRFRNTNVTAKIIATHPELSVGRELLQALEREYPGIAVPYSRAACPKFADVRYKGKSIVHATFVKPGGFVQSEKDIDDAWDSQWEKLRKQHGAKQAARMIEKLKKSHVWHHEWDGETLYLIPKTVHDVFKHTGGDALRKAGFFEALESFRAMVKKMNRGK